MHKVHRAIEAMKEHVVDEDALEFERDLPLPSMLSETCPCWLPPLPLLEHSAPPSQKLSGIPKLHLFLKI